MTKKSGEMKRRLGRKLKQNRRMPVLATVRTHRRLQFNTFARDWRHKKIKKG
jgi:ribosomal protein L39E